MSEISFKTLEGLCSSDSRKQIKPNGPIRLKSETEIKTKKQISSLTLHLILYRFSSFICGLNVVSLFDKGYHPEN